MARKISKAALVALFLAYMAASCALEMSAPPPPAPVLGEQ